MTANYRTQTMRLVVSALSCMTLLLAAGASRATENGWVNLFDGVSLEGWRTYNKDAPGKEWIVEDGAIVLDVDTATTMSSTGGDLITTRQFENFELELEWKISEGGNSGIFFGVREIPGQVVVHETGVEMQVLDDDRHADGKFPERRAGSSYALYAPAETVTRPVGEYNKVRLVVREGRVSHWLNGQEIVTYDMNSPDWDARVAASKFADWPHFARYRKGHIGLQDHTDRVWYRNIRIREL